MLFYIGKKIFVEAPNVSGIWEVVFKNLLLSSLTFFVSSFWCPFFTLDRNLTFFKKSNMIVSHYRSDNNNVLDTTYIYHYYHKIIKVLHFNGHRIGKRKSAVVTSVVKFSFLRYKYLLRNNFKISESHKTSPLQILLAPHWAKF